MPVPADPGGHADLERRVLALEASLVEQEHRTIRVVQQFLEFRRLPPDDPRRSAALRALLWRIFGGGTAATAGIAAVSLFSLFVAFQANRLLEKQNQKIDQQTFLADGVRRAGMVAELTNVLDAIQNELKAPDSPNPDAASRHLSAGLQGRTVALSRALTPYYYLDYARRDRSKKSEPALIANPLSPERGQLILALSHLRVTIEESTGGLMVDYADLDSAGFPRKAQLRELQFRWARLDNANFHEADFSSASVEFSSAIDADFDNAVFQGAELFETDFTDASFSQAKLIWTSVDLSVFDRASFHLACVDMVADEEPPRSVAGATFDHAVVSDRAFELLRKTAGFDEKRWERQAAPAKSVEECGMDVPAQLLIDTLDVLGRPKQRS